MNSLQETKHYLPLLQPIADECAKKNGWAFAQIYGKRENEYVFKPFPDSSEPMVTGLYFAIFIDIDSMTPRVEQNILLNELFENCKKIRSRKGERIFAKKIEKLHANALKGKERDFWNDILSAVNPGYDVPINLEDIYDYLDAANRLNLKLKIVPDRDFQKGGAREEQCDGWTYHIELK